MFDLIPKFFSSIASFLFPLFASYKALKTSDPAQLTPWLMYWSVLSCALLVESWTEFILVWIPFYAWFRLFFLLWLVLPSTQGARYLYETYLHPYLEENETAIEDFIATSHDRLKAAGLAYLRRAIEYLRTQILGMAPSEIRQEESTQAAGAGPQRYTQALLARFSVPAARWAANNAGTAGQDFFNLLAGAVSAATTARDDNASGAATSASRGGNMSASGTLVPDNLGGAQEKISFIAAQKERLAFMMGALDKEAAQLEKNEKDEQSRREMRASSINLDGGGGNGGGSSNDSRPPSAYSVFSGLSKSRSEVDFEKIDAESGAEEDESGNLRRRAPPSGDDEGEPAPTPSARSGWNFLGWGTYTAGQSSGVEK